MKKFILKTCLFLCPILILIVVNFSFLRNGGELYSPTKLSIENQSNRALIGLAYSDPVIQFKHKNIQSRKPEIIALGTSRVLQFRDIYFTEPHKFYNAGRSITKIKDLEPFVKHYPITQPKIIILGLDQDFFSAQYDSLSSTGFNNFESTSKFSGRLLSSSRNFTADLFNSKINWEFLTKKHPSNRIGYTALTHNEGFRVDGSYLYGRLLLSENDDYMFSDVLNRIKKQKPRFAPAEINRAAVDVYEKFLGLCAAENIYLITFLPPYSHRVYDELAEKSDQYPYIFQLHDTLAPLCKKYNYPLYDFSDLKTLGANDFETIDGFHGSETAYFKIAHLIFQNEPKFKNILDADKVRYFSKTPFSARQLLSELDEIHPKPSTIAQ